MSVAIKSLYPYGDSATLNSGYNVYLVALLTNQRNYQLWRQNPAMNAVGGRTVASGQDSIDAELSAASGTPDVILFNLGKNDVGGALVEANWKADLGYILDAIHAKWASATVLMMRAWRQGYDAECDTIAGWLATVIASRSWCVLGPDERIFLKGSDDGATYTTDGIHPNDAGSRATAAQWAQYIP